MKIQKIILFLAIIFFIFYEMYLMKKSKDKAEKMFLITIVVVQIIYLLTYFFGFFIKSKILIIIEEMIHFLFFIFLLGTIFFNCKKNIIMLSIIIGLFTILSRLFFYNKTRETGCLFSLSRKKKGGFMNLWDGVIHKLNFDYIYTSVLIINIYYYYTC